MNKFPFEDFLQNPLEYVALQEYWKALVESIANESGQYGEWKPWRPTTYGDGVTPLPMDGNPILDARSYKQDKAIRIIQDDSSSLVPIAAWVEIEKMKDEFEELPAYELVINLALSHETRDKARSLLRKWIDPQITAQDMKAEIEKLLGAY